MAEWIGHLIAGLPSWLFIPALIAVVVIGFVAVWVFDVWAWTWKDKRADLGEKKNAKK